MTSMYDHYPMQKRLDNDAKIIATKMVKMKVNKKILQNDTQEHT
ncbi:PHD domain-containing protein, partial [Aphis craccivora]